MASPTARTLTLLRRCGYSCCVLESWVPMVNKRRDAFGFGDVLACHPVRKEVVLIQATTAAHLAHRLAKAKALPALKAWLAAGGKFWVMGWRKAAGGKWEYRRVEVQAGDVDLQAVEVEPTRRRGKRPVQKSFFEDPGS